MAKAVCHLGLIEFFVGCWCGYRIERQKRLEEEEKRKQMEKETTKASVVEVGDDGAFDVSAAPAVPVGNRTAS